MIRGGPESFEAREKHLRDGRDLARDVAVALEQQVAAALALHEPTLYCLAHGVEGHACNTGHWVRCFECAQEYRDGRPCRTFLALCPEWSTP